MMKAVKNEEIYELFFTYDVRLIRAVRCLPGWKWDQQKNCGVCKASPAAKSLLVRLGFVVEGGEDARLAKPDYGVPSKPVVFNGVVKSPFFGMLRDYQKEGVRRIIGANGRALLADEMGLGKTVQALTWLEHIDVSPVVVVTTASTTGNWMKEATVWTTRIPFLLSGRKTFPLPKADLYVVNYHIVAFWEKELAKTRPVAIVLDECHNVKNPKAQRTKAVRRLARKIPQFVAMSGTPLMSNPIELFPIINLIDPKTFKSRPQFGMEFCNPQIDNWSGAIVYKGVSNVERLRALLNPFTIRRLKSDVLSELPVKQRTRFNVEIDNMADYQKIKKMPLLKANALGIQNRARELMAITARGKTRSLFEWLDDWLLSGEKLFIGVFHVEIVNLLMARYKRQSLAITGATPVSSRLGVCEQFDDDPQKLFLFGQLEAAGEGINLQKSCSNVLFVEYPWTPSRLAQFEDRVHRFGQRKGVNIWYSVAKGTVEEKVLEILLDKADVVSSVLDETREIASVTAEIRRFLESNV